MRDRLSWRRWLLWLVPLPGVAVVEVAVEVPAPQTADRMDLLQRGA